MSRIKISHFSNELYKDTGTWIYYRRGDMLKVAGRMKIIWGKKGVYEKFYTQIGASMKNNQVPHHVFWSLMHKTIKLRGVCEIFRSSVGVLWIFSLDLVGSMKKSKFTNFSTHPPPTNNPFQVPRPSGTSIKWCHDSIFDTNLVGEEIGSRILSIG